MKIYGIDFTSAPGPRKAITFAECRLAGDRFSLERLGSLTSFVKFESFLREPGPWMVGLDFPFSQPRKLIENLGWPQQWEQMIRQVAGMSKDEFVRVLETYCQGRETGDKHHLRLTDKLARSRSPMMVYRVPVGKMFFEGAPRLLEAGLSIPPCHIRNDSRIALEAYPALVARRWIGGRSYKTDTTGQRTDTQQLARQAVLSGLCSSDGKKQFGFEVQAGDLDAESLIQDGSGDLLDALLCAVQAGWAHTQRDQNFGIPDGCDALEGWIVDPSLGGGQVPSQRQS